MAVGEEEEKEKVTELQKKAEEDQEEAKVAMQPWEQHSAVIILPRYDYSAPSSLLHHSHSGFLITCPIKREKSATKEAISILEKFIGCNSFLEEPDANEVNKRRKLCSVDGQSEDAVQTDELLEGAGLSSEKTEDLVEQKTILSLVKLTRSGLLLFTFPKDNSLDPVCIVSNIHQSIDCGALKHPLWCHRIFPIQATCILGEKEVGSTVSSLFRGLVNNQAIKFSTPLKFAVGYNRRGIDQTELKSAKNSSSDPRVPVLLDRDKCFATVAAAVKSLISDAVVDLKSPEICILIECLPLSGVPNGSLVVAVSVLPQSLVSTKPRLSIKALVSDSKFGNGGQSKG